MTHNPRPDATTEGAHYWHQDRWVFVPHGQPIPGSDEPSDLDDGIPEWLDRVMLGAFVVVVILCIAQVARWWFA